MQEENPDDLVRLHDMLEAAQKIRDLVARESRTSFDENEVLQLALRYLVLIIGEAAYHLLRERRARYPGIPWAQIIGMRHHLVHGYSAVDLNILWTAVSENTPQLIAELEHILREDFGIVIEPFSLDLHLESIREYCQSQPILRLSELPPEYSGWLRPDTEIGFAVVYAPGATVTLLDMAGHEIDLGEIIGKGVSVQTAKGLRDGSMGRYVSAARLIYEKTCGD